jgi:hypothetical protein
MGLTADISFWANFTFRFALVLNRTRVLAEQ